MKLVASWRISRGKPFAKRPAALRAVGPVLAAAIFCSLITGTASLSAKVVNKVVAVVNGEVVTLYDLNSRLDTISGKTGFSVEDPGLDPDEAARQGQILQAMINDILLLQEAERLGIEIPESIVTKRIERIKREQGFSDREFEELLQENGLTRSEYVRRMKEEIKKNRLLQAMVREKVLVTQEEIEAYYQEHKSEYREPGKMHLKILVMKDRKELTRIRERISRGTLSFGEAAGKFSQGPGASQGGDLGLLHWEDLQTRWKKALKGLEPGQLTPVFQLGNQVAVLLLDGIQPGKPLSLKEVRERIRKRLYAEKLRTRYNQYIGDLRSKAVIDVRL